jgi:hypothetical protein
MLFWRGREGEKHMEVRNTPFLKFENPKIGRARVFFADYVKESGKVVMRLHTVYRGIVGTVREEELRNEEREAVTSNELKASPGFIREAIYFSTFRNFTTRGSRNIAVCPMDFARIAIDSDVRNCPFVLFHTVKEPLPSAARVFRCFPDFKKL